MNARTTQVRVLKDLLEQLKPMAEADGRTVTKYIEKILKEHLEG